LSKQKHIITGLDLPLPEIELVLDSFVSSDLGVRESGVGFQVLDFGLRLVRGL
jgi:hypothetical protein